MFASHASLNIPGYSLYWDSSCFILLSSVVVVHSENRPDFAAFVIEPSEELMHDNVVAIYSTRGLSSRLLEAVSNGFNVLIPSKIQTDL
jgi:hypothetical protein